MSPCKTYMDPQNLHRFLGEKKKGPDDPVAMLLA